MSLPKKALSATSEQAVPSATVSEHTSSAPYALFTQSLFEGLHHPVAVLLLQIISILVAVRIFSWLFKYLGQPGVSGEIVAGIVLGPSVLGHFSLRHSVSCFPIPPRITQYPQPDRSDPFMFIIGMELDLSILRKREVKPWCPSTPVLSLPFSRYGFCLAWFIQSSGAGHTTFVPFALFIGISVSITAFPVLAELFRNVIWARPRWVCWLSPVQPTMILRQVPAGRHYCHCQSRKCCQCRVYPVVRDCVCAVYVRLGASLYAQTW